MLEWLYKSGWLDTVKTAHVWIQIVTVFIFGLWLARKMDIKLWRAAILMFATRFALGYINPFLYWVERGFQGEFRGGHLTRSFIFLPLVFLLLFLIIREKNIKRGLDFMALVMMLYQSFAHIYCLYAGCNTCRGYPMENGGGVYNVVLGIKLFPVQLFDGITAFLIFLLMLATMIEKKYDGKGIFWPVLLVAHGIERFFWDFFRSYDDVLWNLTALQLWAIGSILVGAVWLVILRRAEIKAWIGRMKEKAEARKKAKSAPPPKTQHKKKKKKKKKR